MNNDLKYTDMLQGISKKPAFDRLPSTEELDKLLKTTDRQSWIVLTAIAVTLIASIVWSVLQNL